MSQKSDDAYINGMHGIGHAEYVLVQGHYEYEGRIKMDSLGMSLSLFNNNEEVMEYDGPIYKNRHKSHGKLHNIMIDGIDNECIVFRARA
ncbi:hypothetical protein FEMY_24610 [Ferrovum myxofaciens]|uniref:Uncharacterized protein n=1 Tax=Ferrovum myxofaciens TaxID=416213 RepID=A0A149VUX6_9PROT|nr:hypothetical protein [Ferrovum myxofaciens]KXW57025.1 hypothetical protein FEMY_24610 [Ferrovum myxofaciens]